MKDLTERLGKLSPAKHRILVERLAKTLAGFPANPYHKTTFQKPKIAFQTSEAAFQTSEWTSHALQIHTSPLPGGGRGCLGEGIEG